MKNSILILTALLLAGCASSRPEADVYRAIFLPAPWCGDDAETTMFHKTRNTWQRLPDMQPSPYFVCSFLTVTNLSLDSDRDFDISDPSVREVAERFKQPFPQQRMEPTVFHGLPVRMAEVGRLDTPGASPEQFWTKYRETHTNSLGLIYFSPVVFSSDGTAAGLYFAELHGPISGSGYLILFKKVGHYWLYHRVIGLWQS